MTTTRHTPIATGAAATAAVLNAPLGELDAGLQAITVGTGGWATTLDGTAASGQKVVPVASTANAAVGMPVWIGLTSGTHEVGVIASIDPGVSVTLAANLAGTYAALDPISATPAEVADARGAQATLGASLEIIRSHGVDIRDHGATDDTGGTDHSAAFAAAAAAGDLVHVPAGTWLAKGIAMRSGLSIEGVSPRLSIIKVSDMAANGIDVVGTAAWSPAIVQAAVRHLSLTGPGKASGAAGSAIFAQWGAVLLAFEDLLVSGFGSHGIRLASSYSLALRDVFLDSNGGDGLHGESAINQVTLDHCIAIANAGAGYAVKGGATVVALNCDAESNTGAGFDIRDVTSPVLHGCHLEQNGQDGTSPQVYLHYATGLGDKVHNADVRGNYLNGAGVSKRGIVVDGSSAALIEGNWLNNHVTDHIQVTANADRTMVGTNSYIGTGTELTDASASTARLGYDFTNLLPRVSPGLMFAPRAADPAVLADGEVWYRDSADQLWLRAGAQTRAIVAGLQASAALDFGSIAAGATAELDVYPSGAAAGDKVVATPTALPAGLVFCAYVPFADTVRIRLHNTTAGAIDPASTTWKVVVLK